MKKRKYGGLRGIFSLGDYVAIATASMNVEREPHAVKGIKVKKCIAQKLSFEIILPYGLSS